MTIINAMKLALEALENASPAAWASRVDSDTMKSIWRKHAEALEGLQVLLAELDNASCKSVQKRLEAQQPATGIEIDFKQTTELLAMFGGEPATVTLMPGDGHRGKGLYAYYTDLPEEGAEFLGEADDEAVPDQQPAKGEPFGYIHHFAAHDESGALIDTTWEADGCADPLPHPTFPAMWKWTHCTPFYTTPQPAQATQAEVTDEQLNAVALEQWGPHAGGPLAAHRAFARAILALRPEPTTLTGCKCRWDGDTQVEWCDLHLAHKEAIHEWAERAKEAEKQLALRTERVPMTDERSVPVKVDRELFRFHSEQDWVNKARSRYANCVVQKGHYITVDAAGHVMHMGLCFKHAVYPVTVYQLQTNWPKEKA